MSSIPSNSLDDEAMGSSDCDSSYSDSSSHQNPEESHEDSDSPSDVPDDEELPDDTEAVEQSELDLINHEREIEMSPYQDPGLGRMYRDFRTGDLHHLGKEDPSILHRPDRILVPPPPSQNNRSTNIAPKEKPHRKSSSQKAKKYSSSITKKQELELIPEHFTFPDGVKKFAISNTTGQKTPHYVMVCRHCVVAFSEAKTSNRRMKRPEAKGYYRKTMLQHLKHCPEFKRRAEKETVSAILALSEGKSRCGTEIMVSRSRIASRQASKNNSNAPSPDNPISEITDEAHQLSNVKSQSKHATGSTRTLDHYFFPPMTNSEIEAMHKECLEAIIDNALPF